jgi:anthranilate phosphoribosyltransferase
MEASLMEMSLMGSTRICKAGRYQSLVDEEIHPADLGMEIATVESLQGGDARCNAEILFGILSGDVAGPKRDMVALNAGAAIACAGLADDLGQGIDLARRLIADGSALQRLKLLQKHARL